MQILDHTKQRHQSGHPYERRGQRSDELNDVRLWRCGAEAPKTLFTPSRDNLSNTRLVLHGAVHVRERMKSIIGSWRQK